MKLFNLLYNVFSAQAGAAAFSASSSGAQADVTISGGNGDGPACTISEDQLAEIKKRIKKLLAASIGKGYSDFPVNRAKLISKTTAMMLTEKTICNALTSESGATEETHNKIREKYNGNCLSPSDAWKKGVIAKRIPLETSCPENYDWENSPFYNEVTTCEDVVEAIGDDGLPTAMYVTGMNPPEIQSYLAEPSIASLYTEYANSGPIMCKNSSKVQVSFHKIFVSKALPTLDYIMRSENGQNWSAWQLLRSCTAESGTTYKADDLMFNFGVRIMAPVTVDMGGERITDTLIISSVAAAAKGSINKIVPPWLSYQRFIGAEYAKKVLLEAKSMGWEIK